MGQEGKEGDREGGREREEEREMRKAEGGRKEMTKGELEGDEEYNN